MFTYSLGPVAYTLRVVPRLMVVFAVATAAAACAGPVADGPAAVELQGAVMSASAVATAPTSPGWQALARSYVAAGNQSPLAAGRVYAALSVAQYGAVVQTDAADVDGALPENGVGRGGRAAREAQRGAVAGASAEVLTYLYPARAADIAARVQTEAEATPGAVHPQFTRGLAIGKTVGAAMVNRLMNDQFTVPFAGTLPVGPDKWVSNGAPAGATLPGMTPYLLTQASQFRAPAPLAFGTPAFDAAVAEIKQIELNRTAPQIASANYWNLPNGTYTPIGYWDATAASYIAQYGLDERAATRAFALTTVAMMDALIGCWDSKYEYLVRRPSQVDATISLVFGLPNHPSYPSGHSCSSSAAATVLSQLFPAKTAELTGWVAEAGLSRKYAGIHYQFDVTAGENLGRSVGQWTLQRDAQVGLLGAIQ